MAFEIALEASRLIFYSPYNADDCAKRISAVIDDDDSIASVRKEFDGTHDLIGRADAGTVRLRKRMPSSYSFYGALFKPIFNGTLKPHGAGAAIEGTCAMHGFGRGFVKLAFWAATGFLALMWVILLAKILFGNADARTGWGLGVVPLVMGAGFLYARWMKRLAKEDVVFVTRFLRETLQADDRPNAS